MQTVTSQIGHNYAQSDQALFMYSRVNIPPPFSIISACIWLLVKFPVLLGPYSHMFNKIEYFPFAASGTLVIAECHPFTRENGTVQVFGFVIAPELNKSLFIAALLKLLFYITHFNSKKKGKKYDYYRDGTLSECVQKETC